MITWIERVDCLPYCIVQYSTLTHRSHKCATVLKLLMPIAVRSELRRIESNRHSDIREKKLLEHHAPSIKSTIKSSIC